MEEIEQFCCEQIEVMSKKRILALVDGNKHGCQLPDLV